MLTYLFITYGVLLLAYAIYLAVIRTGEKYRIYYHEGKYTYENVLKRLILIEKYIIGRQLTKTRRVLKTYRDNSIKTKRRFHYFYDRIEASFIRMILRDHSTMGAWKHASGFTKVMIVISVLIPMMMIVLPWVFEMGDARISMPDIDSIIGGVVWTLLLLAFCLIMARVTIGVLQLWLLICKTIFPLFGIDKGAVSKAYIVVDKLIPYGSQILGALGGATLSTSYGSGGSGYSGGGFGGFGGGSFGGGGAGGSW